MLTRAELRAKITEIDELIANGITEVRDSDGKTVKYRSLVDLKKAREQLVSDLNSAKSTRRPMGRCILVGRGL